MRLAHRLAASNLRTLVEQVDRGFDIVASCPSCALALQHHFPQILDGSAEAERVAAHTFDIGAFLLREQEAGRLDTRLGAVEKRAGYHIPCHMRVRDAGRENVALLGLVPGLEVRIVDRGCCGLSGSFGLKAHNRCKSAEIGRELFAALLDPEIDLAMTDCAGCEMQIRYGTGREVAHPIRLLWQAYSALSDIPDQMRRHR
jgi:glycerol-3-phosphate dehydrogenase subunit C